MLTYGFFQALKDEGHNPDEYLFDINAGKGKPGKPVTPSKAKEPEKEEDPVVAEPTVVEMDAGINNNNNSAIEDDELIIKDELDNDCFEEVDRIGEIEKEVKPAPDYRQ